MPALAQVRGVALEEIGQELCRVSAARGERFLYRMVRPTSGILVVKNIAAQLSETDHELQIVPRDAADRKEANHSRDDDPRSGFHFNAALARAHVLPLS
jgi:hypothetical protein